MPHRSEYRGCQRSPALVTSNHGIYLTHPSSPMGCSQAGRSQALPKKVRSNHLIGDATYGRLHTPEKMSLTRLMLTQWRLVLHPSQSGKPPVTHPVHTPVQATSIIRPDQLYEVQLLQWLRKA